MLRKISVGYQALMRSLTDPAALRVLCHPCGGHMTTKCPLVAFLIKKGSNAELRIVISSVPGSA